MDTAEDLRRRAAESEDLASQISLRTDREKMMEIARRLRREADELEAEQQQGDRGDSRDERSTFYP